MKTLRLMSAALLILLAFSACHTTKETSERDRMFDMLNNQLVTAKVTRMGDTVRVVFPELAMFDFGKDEIKNDAKPAFVSFANILKSFPGYNVKINGYTDNVGTDDVNMGLSNRRAMSGMSVLTANGIGANRITVEGRGPRNPLMSNETDYGRSVNRRVEFLVY